MSNKTEGIFELSFFITLLPGMGSFGSSPLPYIEGFILFIFLN